MIVSRQKEAARLNVPGALIVIGLTAALLAQPAAAGEKLTWRDLAGRKYTAPDIKEASATVLVFTSTVCPCAGGYNGRVEALRHEFGSRKTSFFLVYSGADADEESVRRYVSRKRLTIPAVADRKSVLARRFNVKTTPTAVVLGPDGAVRYQGRIDDNPDPQAVVRQDLREALNDVLLGSEVRLAKTTAIGCAVGKSNVNENGRPKLVEGIGTVKFPVTTRSRQAQKYFNQAINRWFGFNFPEAEVSFREAARLDPRCAMAQWGIALSLGMNYNMDFDPSRLPEAEAAAQKALQLAANATPKERALIEAMALRHAPGKEMAKQLQPYHAAMARIYFEDPEDVNVAVLYAASGMDLHPWKLWSPSGQPAPGTLEVILVLEDAMRRDPNHIGANHYYIHATEASPFPERALKCTGRLAAQAPNSGHLVHMPSHTYIRVGDYRASVAANIQAAKVDAAYFAAKGKPTNYGGYYIHNLDFIVASLLWEGRSREAIEAARELSQAAATWTPEFASLFCGTGSGIMTVYARFGMWDEILNAPAADETNPFSAIAWRYARGMALVARKDLAGAQKELAALEALLPAGKKAAAGIPIPGMPEGLAHAMETGRLHLAGKMAVARGAHEDAEKLYREAITHEDAIPYTEPPTWRHPVRESLGALLLSRGKAAEAELVFRQALKVHPRSGRPLFGLAEALERQGKRDEAQKVRRQFDEAWARADVKLTLSAL